MLGEIFPFTMPGFQKGTFLESMWEHYYNIFFTFLFLIITVHLNSVLVILIIQHCTYMNIIIWKTDRMFVVESVEEKAVDFVINLFQI